MLTQQTALEMAPKVSMCNLHKLTTLAWAAMLIQCIAEMRGTAELHIEGQPHIQCVPLQAQHGYVLSAQYDHGCIAVPRCRWAANDI